ncbi:MULTISPECIES: DUF4345 family protein [Arenimonas]|uniref:DUF4345 domain-containing protein n=1 Tax=Arenimonas metalli CF5-1 TaxID=1384056 RepID=A0A091B8R3_9GAMM|nr:MULTISPECIES: DUF4345 family protein [Arenimonas]KFN48126.1 hypothetical protein N787_06710 [Arenimonas metalli CF5-1]HEX4852877.1 DUF4345 family protein [Arenimonas sp.]
MERFGTVVLVLAALGFLGFGLAIVAAPEAVLAPVGISGTAAGLVELRAFYGGLELGLAAFLFACAAKPAWRAPGLWSVALANGGIAAARLLGIGLSGEFTGFFAAALAWEIGFTLAAVLALRGRPG